MLTAQGTHTELPLAALYSVSRLNIHSLIFSAECFLELGGWGPLQHRTTVLPPNVDKFKTFIAPKH